MKKLLVISVLLLCSFFALQTRAEGHTSNESDTAIHPVSLLALITNPTKYDGKVVQVEGVFGFYFSESQLFASLEWYKHNILGNSVTLQLQVKGKEIDKLASWTGRYVVVTGIFDAKTHGPFGMPHGTIKDVSSLHLMSEPIVGGSKKTDKRRVIR